MASNAPVGVVGLQALFRDAKRLGLDTGPLGKAVQQAGKAAGEPVANIARSTVPKSSGDLAGDIRVTASRTGAAVRMGRARVPYAGWVEFGGKRQAPHFSARTYVPNGRYLFDAARGRAAQSAQLFSDAVTRALADFDWTNSSTASPGAVHD
jgi:hypothetical protein